MKQRLLWKLLLTNIVPVIAIIFVIVWLAIDKLAASYFMELMNKYEVSPTAIHQMFLSAIHHYLIWASLAALFLAFILSYLLTRRVLRPLQQMTKITQDVAAGNFQARVDIVSQDEVGQLGIAFNSMADSLAQVEKLRKSMVADLAHELRTPLTNLRGYLEALTDEVVPPSQETFQMLQQEILRLVHLVDNLQQLARADAARAYLHKESVLLVEAVNQMLELYRPNFKKKNIQVELTLASNAQSVTADRDKLLQAIRNLMENSWKYTPAHGRVSITSEKTKDGTRVLFSNNGSAISQDDLPYIFERFFRAEKSRSRDAGGAGIGLSIVKELIEAHGGQVGADSTDDETRIWFTLPA